MADVMDEKPPNWVTGEVGQLPPDAMVSNSAEVMLYRRRKMQCSECNSPVKGSVWKMRGSMVLLGMNQSYMFVEVAFRFLVQS